MNWQSHSNPITKSSIQKGKSENVLNHFLLIEIISFFVACCPSIQFVGSTLCIITVPLEKSQIFNTNCMIVVCFISDLMRDEQNGNSIKISSKGLRVCSISVKFVLLMSTLAMTLLSMLRTTTSSL